MNKVEFNKTLAEAMKLNPYIEKASKISDDKFQYFDRVYYLKELVDSYRDTASKDIEVGYRDRMVGYYDKWYRYSRQDGGRAYDMGVKLALANPKCKQEFHVIESV